MGTILNLRSLKARFTSSISGISLTQGAHVVYQKLRKTTLPRRSLSLSSWPFSSLIANSGAGSPTLTSVEAGFRKTKNMAAAATTTKQKIGFRRDMPSIVSRVGEVKSRMPRKRQRESRRERASLAANLAGGQQLGLRQSGCRPALPTRKMTRRVRGSMLVIMPAETISRKLFTVEEYRRMSDIGIFPEDKRFELIRGEIFEMPSAKPPHSGRIIRLTHLFTSRLGDLVRVSVQNPSSVDQYSEPVPDVSLLKPRPDFYTESHPLPSDILLVIEVSSTTLRFDTKVKATLYAEAGIAEYWVLNPPENVVEVRTEPWSGQYTKLEIF